MERHEKSRKNPQRAGKNPKKLNRLSTKWNIAFSVILIFTALVTFLPLALVIVISFSSTDSINHAGYTFFPQGWSLEGYAYLLKIGEQMVKSYRITIIYSVVGTAMGVLVMMLYAYVISQKDFWCHRQLTWFLFFTMLFGGGLVSSYIINVRYFHLKDTIWILLLPGLVGASNVIILKTFLRTSIPEALFDAAKIDGAGHFTIFFRVVMPLSKAGIATVALFNFVGKWNDWFTGMLYIENPNLVPLQTLLLKLQGSVDYLKANSGLSGTPDGLRMLKTIPTTNLRMACTLVAILPILFAYPFFQRYFVNGMTMGSIKE